VSTDLATRPAGALAITSDQDAFTEAQLEAFGIKDATRGEQLLFLHTIQKTGLDPAARQIYMVPRRDKRSGRDKYTIQTGIDGYRLIADRTSLYAGSEEAWQDGQGRFPLCATVTVWKIVQGNLRPFKATAHWDEYVQTYGADATPVQMWSKMPRLMLSKCAEALALRKAFPQELSGVYTAEEMAQADNQHAAEVTVDPEPARPVAAQDVARQWHDYACNEARKATAATDLADLRAPFASAPAEVLGADVSSAVTGQERTAVVMFDDRVLTDGVLTLRTWLVGCAAHLDQGGGMSVAQALAAGEEVAVDAETGMTAADVPVDYP
jgi:phage recombination protein Bet